MRLRLLDRAGMEVVADELGFGESLGHHHGRPAVAATNVCDSCPRLELLDDATQGWKPCGHEMIFIAGPEKAGHRAEHAAGLITPGDTTTRLECSLNLRLVVKHCRHQIETAHQVDGAVLDREHHGLFGRQREFRRCRVVGQVVGARLMGKPLAQVPRVDLCGVGKLNQRHRPVCVQRPVQSKCIAHSDHGGAGCTSQIRQHLTDECVELAFINLCRIIQIRHDLSPVKLTSRSDERRKPLQTSDRGVAAYKSVDRPNQETNIVHDFVYPTAPRFLSECSRSALSEKRRYGLTSLTPLSKAPWLTFSPASRRTPVVRYPLHSDIVQSSNLSRGTRLNSRPFAVTRSASRRRACAATSTS